MISQAFKTELQTAQRLLGGYQLEEAKLLLNSLRSENAHQERMRMHYLARAEMRGGRMQQALTIIDETLASYPSYIGLKADRLSCLYHLGPKTAWREAIIDFENELEMCREQLSLGSRYRAELLMAKFLEEDGDVAKALKIYEQLRELLKSEKQFREEILVTAQILRVRALFSEKLELVAPLYRDLLTLETNENELYQDIEVQHALMLAELALFGSAKALARLKSVVPFAPAQDIKLFAFDFLEFALRKNIALEDCFKTLVLGLEDKDLFESTLIQFVQEQEPTHCLLWPRDMSLSAYLKAMNLLACKTSDEAVTQELNLVLESLTSSSRTLWRRFFGSEDSTKEFSFSAEKKMISFDGREVSLSKKPAILKLLTVVSVNGVSSLEELTKEIWESSYDHTYYNRLRVLAQRTEALFNEISGLRDLVQFSADGITISCFHSSSKRNCI